MCAETIRINNRINYADFQLHEPNIHIYFINPSNHQTSTNAHWIPAHVIKMLFVATERDLTVVHVKEDSLEMEQFVKVR